MHVGQWVPVSVRCDEGVEAGVVTVRDARFPSFLATMCRGAVSLVQGLHCSCCSVGRFAACSVADP